MFTDSYHRYIKWPHAGILSNFTCTKSPQTEVKSGLNAGCAGGVLHHLQTPRPRRRAHEPQECKRRRHHKILATDIQKCPKLTYLALTKLNVLRSWDLNLILWLHTHKHRAKVRISVYVHVTQINQQSHHGVEKGQDGYSHKELDRGRRISYQMGFSNRLVAKARVVLHQKYLTQPLEINARDVIHKTSWGRSVKWDNVSWNSPERIGEVDRKCFSDVSITGDWKHISATISPTRPER